MSASLAAIDRYLGERGVAQWLVGKRMTQADITAVCAFTFLNDTLRVAAGRGHVPVAGHARRRAARPCRRSRKRACRSSRRIVDERRRLRTAFSVVGGSPQKALMPVSSRPIVSWWMVSVPS